jgi:uncharacterized membrane protein
MRHCRIKIADNMIACGKAVQVMYATNLDFYLHVLSFISFI